MDANFKTPETLQAAIEFFADPDNCHSYMVQMRWPDGIVICPICNKPEPRYLAKQRRFECRSKHPRRQFSVKVGTIFEDSPIALKSWLLAVWQIVNCKNGISSYELARALGVTQKTAWFMNHRIRLAMQNEDGGQLDGETAQLVDMKYRIIRYSILTGLIIRLSCYTAVMRSRRKQAVVDEGPLAAVRFDSAMNRMLRVSKDELAKREAAYQEASRAKIRRGPKPTEK